MIHDGRGMDTAGYDPAPPGLATGRSSRHENYVSAGSSAILHPVRGRWYSRPFLDGEEGA